MDVMVNGLGVFGPRPEKPHCMVAVSGSRVLKPSLASHFFPRFAFKLFFPLVCNAGFTSIIFVTLVKFVIHPFSRGFRGIKLNRFCFPPIQSPSGGYSFRLDGFNSGNPDGV